MKKNLGLIFFRGRTIHLRGWLVRLFAVHALDAKPRGPSCFAVLTCDAQVSPHETTRFVLRRQPAVQSPRAKRLPWRQQERFASKLANRVFQAFAEKHTCPSRDAFVKVPTPLVGVLQVGNMASNSQLHTPTGDNASRGHAVNVVGDHGLHFGGWLSGNNHDILAARNRVSGLSSCFGFGGAFNLARSTGDNPRRDE